MLSDTMMLGSGRKAAYSFENSLLFRGGEHLYRTPSGAGNRDLWTISLHIRRAAFGSYQCVYSAGPNPTSNEDFIGFDTSDRLCVRINGVTRLVSSQMFRDPTAWGHLVVAYDAANGEPALRLRAYWNGAEITAWNSDSRNGIAVNTAQTNTTNLHRIGRNVADNSGYFKGYLAEVAFVDNAALTSAPFGTVDPVTGTWRPKKLSGISWGARGYLLGAPWNNDVTFYHWLGHDYSGRDNGWSGYAFVQSDMVADAPTNVHATLNPLVNAVPVMTEGNLHYHVGSGYHGVVSSLMVPAGAGKYRMQMEHTGAFTGSSCEVGVVQLQPKLHTDGWLGGEVQAVNAVSWTYNGSGYVRTATDGVAVSTAPAGGVASGTIVDVYLDTAAGTVAFKRDDVLVGTYPLPNATNGPWLFCLSHHYSQGGQRVNFGQRPWAYVGDTSYQALCTANLPATTGQPSGSFTGNASADGPCVYSGAVPMTLTINGNLVTWGVHADRLATGFKIRAAGAAYNGTGANTWTATYDRKPTVGPKGRPPANAQAN